MSVILKFRHDGDKIAGLSTCAFLVVISECAFLVVISAKTEFLDQVKINSTSQLISGIFKRFQKLLKCFSGITTFAFVNEFLSSGVFPAIFVLYLKDSDSELEEKD